MKVNLKNTCQEMHEKVYEYTDIMLDNYADDYVNIDDVRYDDDDDNAVSCNRNDDSSDTLNFYTLKHKVQGFQISKTHKTHTK